MAKDDSKNSNTLFQPHKIMAPPLMLSELAGLSPEQRTKKISQHQQDFANKVQEVYQKAYDEKSTEVKKIPETLNAHVKLSPEQVEEKRGALADKAGKLAGEAAVKKFQSDYRVGNETAKPASPKNK